MTRQQKMLNNLRQAPDTINTNNYRTAICCINQQSEIADEVEFFLCVFARACSKYQQHVAKYGLHNEKRMQKKLLEECEHLWHIRPILTIKRGNTVTKV